LNFADSISDLISLFFFKAPRITALREKEGYEVRDRIRKIQIIDAFSETMRPPSWKEARAASIRLRGESLFLQGGNPGSLEEKETPL